MSIRICDECGNVYDEDAAFFRAHRRRIYDAFECDAVSLVPRCPQCGSPEYVSVPDSIAERHPRRRLEGMAPASR